ncbi:cellulose synthase/poly-beta-1,6-N-acetylglucosamine synthase-like glycosyltransferase [Isoptericola jiangsuensis]|uniref:Cellulose synthase/poly-beta-1,6-N-acetylglucosamine synthase-like glycosyltransferase n=1 Tax=Isoptericola jiangsuensis TaxID=548579 RepID=A0A2A9EWR1_9MICO|nr:glycosyltransferase family 2 protein [Isoptericola jiangsuensis]PFG42951.1 cellulose synthase/poly-beta-1,6-N-acetylglucosamine synthase-like glycosyltransferase [Isoptericola jiangsuensis]
MGDVLRQLVIVLCLVLVAASTLPVLAGIYQYLLLPLHGVRNHWKDCAPYLPRVVVVVPAWNEGAVLEPSLERLMHLEYPPDRLRVFVVDDASTDDTPDVTREMARRYPGRIRHLRRDQGGQGKAHTLNHGITAALADDWMQALLVMDADVVYRPDSLRRMTRHLADERIGAVTGYIKEGSGRPGTVARFIGFEYITAQAAARRAQNVLGAMACLAGGAQLHSRANLEAVGGGIDTTTLAEDTFTTFLTQLDGRRVVFDPTAVVLAEEPESVRALWKQRLRWARGNVQITSHFRRLWFRPSRDHRLGSLSFGLIWFSVYLLPVAAVAAAAGLLTLQAIDAVAAATVFRSLWWVTALGYVYVTILSLVLDPDTARRTWLQAVLFPGVGALLVMAAAWAPWLWQEWIPDLLGTELGAGTRTALTWVMYAWPLLAMALAWVARWLEGAVRWRLPSVAMLYVVGFGPLLCAITLDAYVKEWRGASRAWDKTEKTGRVVG